MINTIYIPTYGRQGNQITFDNLPKKWQDKTFLITHPDQEHTGYPEIKCDAQGKGIAEVRKWICQYGEGKRYGMLDDDIEFLYTKRDGEEGPGNSKLSDEKFDDMINTMDSWMDEGYIHTACDVSWNPPTRNIDFRINSRITTNIFYDGTKMPYKELDWALDFVEDYYVNLQLLTMGYQNKVSLMYRVNAAATQTKGGCENFRTLDIHNKHMRDLRQKYPAFVKLKEKVANSGEWKGVVKLGATISWKKAYESSQSTGSLEEFLQ